MFYASIFHHILNQHHQQQARYKSEAKQMLKWLFPLSSSDPNMQYLRMRLALLQSVPLIMNSISSETILQQAFGLSAPVSDLSLKPTSLFSCRGPPHA